MELKKRGALEKLLDAATKEDYLQAQVAKFQKLKNEGVIDSIKSAVIGAIYLQSLSSYIDVHLDIKEEMLEKDEKYFDEVFLRRVPEITSKLNILLNL